MNGVYQLLFLAVLTGNGVSGNERALRLVNTTGYSTLADNDSLDLAAGAGTGATIEFSFYLADDAAPGVYGLVLKDRAYNLTLELASDGRATFEWEAWRTTGQFDRRTMRGTAPALKPGRHHFAAVFRPEAAKVVRMMLLDGYVLARNDFDQFPTGMAASTNVLTIGGGAGIATYPGWIDEMRLSKSVRYTNDNAPGFSVPYVVPRNQFVTNAETVALWHFDEPSGATTFEDASGNTNHLALVGTANVEAAPMVQDPGTLDLTFDLGLGLSSETFPWGVKAVAVQGDGKLVLAGQFTSAGGLRRKNIARLNPDGSVDPDFAVTSSDDFMPEFRALTTLPNGKMLVGGRFNRIEGAARRGIARLNPDGSLDSAFNAELTGAGVDIHSIEVLPDGKVMIGGAFSSVHGTSRWNIARLQADGALDASFDAGFAVSSPFFDKMLVQTDGKILCNTYTTGIGTRSYSNLVRLTVTGAVDGTFHPAVTTEFPIVNMSLQRDGKILVAGNFVTVNGASRNGVARLHADGSLDHSFDLANSSPSHLSNGGSLSFAAELDGKIYVSSLFRTGPHEVRPQLARFKMDGSLDATFQIPEFFRTDFHVFVLQRVANGKLLIAGEFTDVNGYSRTAVARLNGETLRFLSARRELPTLTRLVISNPAKMPVMVEWAPKLPPTNWSPVGMHEGGIEVFEIVDEAAGEDQRVYRAIGIP